MEKYNIAVLVDAKQEYTHQLIQLLTPHIYVGIKSIYEAANDYCKTTGDKHVLRKFQQLLSEVPKWNTDRIDNEYSRIKALTECDWMDDLITAVFVSHTKVLTAIQLKNKQKKSIELNVPTGEHFIHKCYTEVARAFWKRPYLMNHALPNIEIQRNLADGEQLIKDSIHETVRRMLPVRHILKEYLGNDFNEDQLDNDEDITSQLSVNTRNNLRRLVQQEIEQTLSKGGNDDSHSHAPEVTVPLPVVSAPAPIVTESVSSEPSRESHRETVVEPVVENRNEDDTKEYAEQVTVSDDVLSRSELPSIRRQDTDLELKNESTEEIVDTYVSDSTGHSESREELQLDEVLKTDDDTTRNIDIMNGSKSSGGHKANDIEVTKETTDVANANDTSPVSSAAVSLKVDGVDSDVNTTSLEAELLRHIEENESIQRTKKKQGREEIYDLFSSASTASVASSMSKVSSTSAPRKTATVSTRPTTAVSASTGSRSSFSFFDDACERP